MKRILTTWIIILLSTLCLHAQTNPKKISGRVIDEQNQPIEFTNLLLLNPQDSAFIAGAVSDEEGAFSFNEPLLNSEAILKVSSIGYETVVQTVSPDNSPLTILLPTSSIELQGVVVEASRINRSAKGYSVTLAGSDFTKGKQTSEALAFLPGVTKENGSFKLNGMSVSEIYLNGVKITSEKELESIAGEYLQHAEIEYLAGSESSAGLTGGIIRLQMRRPKEAGYYGNVSLLGGLKPHYGYNNSDASAVINYGYKKWSIFNNLNVYNSNSTEELLTSQHNILSQQKTLDMKELTKYKQTGFFNRLNITYDISKKQSLGISLYAAVRNSPQTTEMSYLFPTSDADQTTAVESKLRRVQSTINYKAALSKGANLFLTGEYLRNLNDTYNELSLAGDNNVIATRNNVDLWKVDAHIKVPIAKSNMLTGGGTIHLINTHFKPDEFKTTQPIASLVEADMHSVSPLGYLSLTGKKAKLQYSVGLNLQQNTIYYQDKNISDKVKNSQSSLSPNIQLMYLLSPQKGHSMMAAFKRTLDDIPYDAINPSIVWTDAHNYIKGNPDLKAPKSNISMIGLSLFRNKLNISGLYANTNNMIYYQTRQNPDRSEVLYTQPVNLSGAQIIGYSIETNLKPAKWWMLKLSGRQEYHKENAMIDSKHFKKGNNRFYFILNNSFTFKNNFGGTLTAIGEPTFKTYDRTYHGVYAVSGSLYKKLYQDNLRLGLDFTLFGKGRKLVRQSENISIVSNNKTHVQRINLSLTWFFNGGKDVVVKSTESTLDYKEIRDTK